MTDLLYVVDPTALTLVELPAQIPNLLVYTLRPQRTASDATEVAANFAGQELAILNVRGRGTPAGGTPTGYSFDVQINGSSFLASGSPTSLSIATPGGPYLWGVSSLWVADEDNPPLFGTGDLLSVSVPTSGNTFPCAIDVVMIPSSQLPLLGG